MAVTPIVGMSCAKTNLSKLTAAANRTGLSITVLNNNRPGVEIRALTCEGDVPTETREAMDEANALAADPGHVSCRDAGSLFSALGL